MAEQADAPEREDDLNQPELEGFEPETPELEEPELSDPELSEPEPGDEDDEEIGFGDEAAPASRGDNSDLVRHLRAEVRKRDEELTGYKTGKLQPVQPQTIELGPKPTLESCEYDEAKFESALDSWKTTKAQADQVQAESVQKAQQVQQRFNARLQTYTTSKAGLKVRDFELAEGAVLAALSPVQQAVAIQAADDSARLVYALGRHPEKLKTLAAIEDPIEFTKALVKLEGQLKVTSRSRTPPEPDRQPRGSAPLAARTDKQLERLEAQAAKSGDRTAVIAYKRQLRTQGRS